MNDLTNRDNAPHVPVPVYVYRFETRYTRGRFSGDEREVMHRAARGIKASIFEKYVRPLPYLFSLQRDGCEKNCFVTWLVFELMFDLRILPGHLYRKYVWQDFDTCLVSVGC